VGAVPREVLFRLPGVPLAVEDGVQLVVDAADVDVRRPDRARLAVDADRLGLQGALVGDTRTPAAAM
jgi:hypothetical protein